MEEENPTSNENEDALNVADRTDFFGGKHMGNRLTKTDSNTVNENYTVNAANMLTSHTLGGTNSSYTNDADGNTLTGGGRTNTWDSQNRMTKCVNGNNTSTFTYGYDGIRHSSVVNGVNTDFVLDNSMFVRELHNGLIKATYFMGASGPAYKREDANGGTVRWYLYDGLGSVLGEVDPNGNITARRKYDVYGTTRAGSDSGTSKHKFVGSLGHPSEDETGLVYMQARYYDPSTGRFVSQDPGLHGINWLSYCNNNPINNVDADGKMTTEALTLWMKAFACIMIGMCLMGMDMQMTIAVTTALCGVIEVLPTCLLWWRCGYGSEASSLLNGMLDECSALGRRSPKQVLLVLVGYAYVLEGVMLSIDAEAAE